MNASFSERSVCYSILLLCNIILHSQKQKPKKIIITNWCLLVLQWKREPLNLELLNTNHTTAAAISWIFWEDNKSQRLKSCSMRSYMYIYRNRSPCTYKCSMCSWSYGRSRQDWRWGRGGGDGGEIDGVERRWLATEIARFRLQLDSREDGRGKVSFWVVW